MLIRIAVVHTQCIAFTHQRFSLTLSFLVNKKFSFLIACSLKKPSCFYRWISESFDLWSPNLSLLTAKIKNPIWPSLLNWTNHLRYRFTFFDLDICYKTGIWYTSELEKGTITICGTLLGVSRSFWCKIYTFLLHLCLINFMHFFPLDNYVRVWNNLFLWMLSWFGLYSL